MAPPQIPPHWGEGNSLPRPHPLGAVGASIFAPSALMLISSLSKPENQTPPLPALGEEKGGGEEQRAVK